MNMPEKELTKCKIFLCNSRNYMKNKDFDAQVSELSDFERQRALRFLRPDDQNRYVTGRLMVRNILAGYLKVRPKDINIQSQRGRKPQIIGYEDRIDFSISHSGAYVGLAIAENLRIGLDIQEIDLSKSLKKMRLVQEYAFHEQEIEYIEEMKDEAEYRRVFYEIWALKESSVKMAGAGISRDMRQFSVLPALKQKKADIPDLDSLACLMDAPDGYTMAASLSKTSNHDPVFLDFEPFITS